MFSLRIVSVDHYLATPLPGIDVCFSDFRRVHVKQVPIVRVFGITPAGQKTCLHLHGIFPYIYVTYDGSGYNCEREMQQIAVSLDRALNISLGNASDAQHVYKVSLVPGIPFYGYHSTKQQFLKIQFYNPLLVKRAVELLQNGAVMNKAFQPYEAHVPFILQMFIDYNLYGMNLLNLASVKFRRKKDDRVKENNLTDTANKSNSSVGSNQSSTSTVLFRKWNPDLMPSSLFIDAERQSLCELEVDALDIDILNKMELMSHTGMSPGLKAIWDDERLRRQVLGNSWKLTPEISQERNDVKMLESEIRYQEKLREKVVKLEENISQPIDLTTDKVYRVYDTTTKQTDQSTSADAALVDETIIANVSQSLSQSRAGSSILNSQDEEMIDILARLCSSQNGGANEDDDSVLSSQKAMHQWGKSENYYDNNNDDEQQNDDERETNEMSQLIWQIDPAQENQQSCQGDDETIPQVDGPVDPKSTNSGLNRIPRCNPASTGFNQRPHHQSRLSRRDVTASSSPYNAGGATLHPIPSPLTNQTFRAPTWTPQSSIQPMANLFYPNQHNTNPFHWNYRDYNAWHSAVEMTSPAFPQNQMEHKKLYPTVPPSWTNASLPRSVIAPNCGREFSAVNPFADGYTVPYNQDCIPPVNLNLNLNNYPPNGGGYYECNSFNPQINENYERVKENAAKYNEYKHHHHHHHQQQQQTQQLQQHPQHDGQLMMPSNGGYSCMEGASGSQVKNFISLQRISYMSQVAWQGDNPREISNPEFSNSNRSRYQEEVIEETSTTAVTMCTDVLAAAMTSSGIDLHSLAEVCPDEPEKVEEMTSIVVEETEQCSVMTSCISENSGWAEESSAWLLDMDRQETNTVENSNQIEYNTEQVEESVVLNEEEQSKDAVDDNCSSDDDNKNGACKIDFYHQVPSVPPEDSPATTVNSPVTLSNDGESKGEKQYYEYPDLSSIIESEELLNRQGNTSAIGLVNENELELQLEESSCDEEVENETKDDLPKFESELDSSQSEKEDDGKVVLDSIEFSQNGVDDEDICDNSVSNCDEFVGELQIDESVGNDENCESDEEKTETLLDNSGDSDDKVEKLVETSQELIDNPPPPSDTANDPILCLEPVEIQITTTGEQQELPEVDLQNNGSIEKESEDKQQCSMSTNDADCENTEFPDKLPQEKQNLNVEDENQSDSLVTEDLEDNTSHATMFTTADKTTTTENQRNPPGKISNKNVDLLEDHYRVPVLEKMASLVRRALSSVHGRELMTDLSILPSIDPSIKINPANDFRACERPRSTNDKMQALSESSCDSLLANNRKNSIYSNGSLAGFPRRPRSRSSRSKSSARRKKRAVQDDGSGGGVYVEDGGEKNGDEVKTRNIGTNVHPHDLIRRSYYMVRYHGLRVAVSDSVRKSDLRKLGKEKLCIPKMEVEEKGEKDDGGGEMKRWRLKTKKGLKMKFSAENEGGGGGGGGEKKDEGSSVALSRTKRLKVDYKPHAFSHIFKFDVMPEGARHNNYSRERSKSCRSIRVPMDRYEETRKPIESSFDWDDQIGGHNVHHRRKRLKKRRLEESQRKKPQLTIFISPGKSKSNKPNIPQNDNVEDYNTKTNKDHVNSYNDAMWNMNFNSPPDAANRIQTPPPQCWSPNEIGNTNSSSNTNANENENESSITVENVNTEDANANDGWVPFSFTLDALVTEEDEEDDINSKFDQLSNGPSYVTLSNTDKVTQMEENSGQKTLLMHRGVADGDGVDVDEFSDISSEHVYCTGDEGVKVENTSEHVHCTADDGVKVENTSEHVYCTADEGVKVENTSFVFNDEDTCPLSDQEENAKEVVVETNEVVSQDGDDGDVKDSLVLSDFTDEEEEEETSFSSNISGELMINSQESVQPLDLSGSCNCSQDLFPLEDEVKTENVDAEKLDQIDQSLFSNFEYEKISDDSNLGCDDNEDDDESSSQTLKTDSPPLLPLDELEVKMEEDEKDDLSVDTITNSQSGIQSFYEMQTQNSTFCSSNQDTMKNQKVFVFKRPPPTREKIMATLEEKGLSLVVHEKAHYSKPEDIPEKQSEFILKNFESKFQNEGLENWRTVMATHFNADASSQEILDQLRRDSRTKSAFLSSSRRVVIIPNKNPPSRKEVQEWVDKKEKTTISKNEILNNLNNFKEQMTSSTQSPVPWAENSDNSQNSSLPYHSTPQSQSRHISPAISPNFNFTPILKKRHFYDNADKDGQPTPKRKKISLLEDIVEPLKRNRLKMLNEIEKNDVSTSQIDGPSPANSFGFKISCDNLQDARTIHEHQYLTVCSLEVHVRTRQNLRPDPELDPIRAIFYCIYNDTPDASIQNITGCIAVDETEHSTTSCSCYDNDQSTTDEPNQNSSCICFQKYKRHLAARSGVTNLRTCFVPNEEKLLEEIVCLVTTWDPDVFVGYEVEMLSWGFVLHRAKFLGHDFVSSLSRVPNVKSGNSTMMVDTEAMIEDSQVLKGRILLSLWQLMRHEVSLNIYRFENVAYHLLHQRIPLYSFRCLTEWFEHESDLYRWKTIEHYVIRARGNIQLLCQVDMINRTSELARLFGIQFYEVLSRGSQFRVESMMLRLAKSSNMVAVSPSIQQRNHARAPECLALIMEPESMFYSNPVLVLDFQSLYPSVIIAYNYCFSTCLGHVDSLGGVGPFKFGCTSLDVNSEELRNLLDHLHISPTGIAYVKPSIRTGILPKMLNDLLETRIMVKKAMKEYKDDKCLKRVLDARQLGLKLIANVTYGYTAANYSGRMPCSEVADSVVGKARETLERAIEMVNAHPSWNARVVYGDTDSMFVHLPGRSKEEAFRIGQAIADAVTASNPKPVKLKFEKVYLPCILQTKKRYVGYMYESPDQKDPVYDAKGIETVRRDGCPAVVKVLEKSIRLLFTTRDLSRVKSYAQRQFQKMFTGRISLQDLTLAREYRGKNGYKPGACVPALELTKRMLRDDRCAEPRVGERVPYVIVYGSPGAPLYQLVRQPEDVLLDPNLRINAHYYVNNMLIPPLQRMFGLLHVDVSQWFKSISRLTTQRLSNVEYLAGKKKGTISQYFDLLSCPVCGVPSSRDLCPQCRGDPQNVVVTLNEQIRAIEKTHQKLSEICCSCSGERNNSKMYCVSLDCPVFYRLAQATRDLNQVPFIRKHVDLLLEF